MLNSRKCTACSTARSLPAGRSIVNTGSVDLSYDGDPRASYLLIEESGPGIRRVEYAVESEVRALFERRVPHAGWIARMLHTARPQLPPTSAASSDVRLDRLAVAQDLHLHLVAGLVGPQGVGESYRFWMGLPSNSIRIRRP